MQSIALSNAIVPINLLIIRQHLSPLDIFFELVA